MNCKEKSETPLSNTDQYQKPRILAAQAPHSGDWMNAIPVGNIGALLSLDELRMAVAIWLGCKICEQSLCRRGKKIDFFWTPWSFLPTERWLLPTSYGTEACDEKSSPTYQANLNQAASPDVMVEYQMALHCAHGRMENPHFGMSQLRTQCALST